MSEKEEKSTSTFNSLGFHTNSAVDFRFAGILDTVSGVFLAMSGMGGRVVAKMSVIVSDRERKCC